MLRSRAAAIAMTVILVSAWLVLAATTMIGPVIVSLPGNGRGLHEGDVVALAMCLAAVVLVWGRALRPRS